MKSEIEVSFTDGARGFLRAWDRKASQAIIDSDRARAPGAPVTIDVRLGETDQRVSLALKSLGSKKNEAGLFTIRFRVHSARKEILEALDAWAARWERAGAIE